MGRLTKSATAKAAMAVAASMFVMCGCSSGSGVVATAAPPAPPPPPVAMAVAAPAPVAMAAAAPVVAAAAPAPAPSCASGQQFADGVYVLQTPFDFAHNGGYNDTPPHYQAPVAQADATLGALKGAEPYASYDKSLAAAYTIAPPYLQAALCTLMSNKGVFIDTSDKAPFGWSFWEVAGQGSGTGRYIAVGKKVWTSGHDLAAIENLILRRLLSDAGAQAIVGSGATVTSAVEQPVSGKLTNVALMAVLAREVGLMLFNDYIDPTRATLKATPCPTFTNYSWSTVASTRFAIQNIEDEYSTTTRRYERPGRLRRNEKAAAPDVKADSDAFRQVFTGITGGSPAAPMPEWADAAAYTKPSNDFAETFRLAAEAYTNPATGQRNVSAITIPFPNATNPAPVDLIANQAIPSSVLQAKMACILNNQALWANP